VGSNAPAVAVEGVLKTPTRQLAHNPALDGARGIAVALVVVYHTGLIDGGWVGVELFFVLSGFLITALLAIEHGSNGRIGLAGFWVRRAKRLLPALFVFLGFIAVYAVAIAEPAELHTIRRDVIGALTYTSNWGAIFGGGGYWQEFQAPSALRHMWSLAVEEQFYLIFPLIAVFVFKSRRPALILGLLTVVALLWQLWMTTRAPVDRVYLGTDTRAFGILLGAWCGVMRGHRLMRLAGSAAPLALLVICVGAYALDGASMSTFQGPFQAISIASAVLVAGLSATPTSRVSHVLSSSPLTALGRWSYGIYLYHWPILVAIAATYEVTPLQLTIIVVPVAVAAAYASFVIVETPIRRGPLPVGRQRARLIAAAAMLTVASLGATTVGARAPIDVDTVAAIEAPSIGDGSSSDVLDIDAVTGLIERATDRPVRVMVVGDSVGASLADALLPIEDAAGIETFSRAAPSCSYDRVATVGSSSFTEDATCVDIVDGWRADVATFRPDVVLFMYGSWSGWTFEGTFRTQCDPVLASYVTELYELALNDLTSQGAHLAMITPAYWRADGPNPELDSAYDCLREVMRLFVADQAENTSLVDVHGMLCLGDDCEATAGGDAVRADGLHYSGAGATTVAVNILEQIVEPPSGGWPATESIHRIG
jgi:peptidoglycan/LPS O-acetylase OafA/YrhL